MKALIEKSTGSKTHMIAPQDNDRNIRIVTQETWFKSKFLGITFQYNTDSIDNTYEWEELPKQSRNVGFGK